jgi:orotate phosphoribosyltransferase
MSTQIITHDMFRREGAIWAFDHEGDPKAPHAEWTGGLCADGYVNSRVVLADPENVKNLASMLIAKAERTSYIRQADWVVGSSYGAITLSYEMARQLKAHHGFVKKSATDPKTMTWDELVIPANAVVLQCEELIATLGTTLKVREAVKVGNPYPVDFMPSVVTIHEYEGVQPEPLTIVSLATRRGVLTWPQSECPLCKQGSPRFRPAQNWEKFARKK